MDLFLAPTSRAKRTGGGAAADHTKRIDHPIRHCQDSPGGDSGGVWMAVQTRVREGSVQVSVQARKKDKEE